ncbi:acetate--CoA ligase family protein [Amorphus orientalis]|uniref:Acyl-CoA synthetase (NDP forming) n=1 Tax=Amorphus orientalis TaxID=649198 RepID=A0AAE3VL98_9HYPH|nr:acetate--CoA ligase family protein [Amorphus orientalis]MDQ0314589.1 acyl-CoA synthetase (NDP forming) [Amorphus orientalis]
MSDSRSSIDRLLRPRSIAIVGASPEPFSLGNNVLSNFATFAYDGPLHLVSRKNAEIDGRRCVGSIDQLPSGIDLVGLVVPASVVTQSVAECAERDVGGVVVFASGFAELGEDGVRAQAEMARIAEDAGIALLGPNCLGFTNFVDGVPMTFERISPKVASGTGVAVVAQSGAMTGNIREALRSRGVPVSYAISTGNEAVTAAEQVMSALVEDPSVGSFAVFVEQIRDPGVFMECARRAWALDKPIVLMHPGRSERSREAAQSHTGAMAGDHAVMETFVRACGVTLADSFDELFDTTVLRHRYPQSRVEGLGIMTNSGAVRGFALDFGETVALPLPTLKAETGTALSELLPDFAVIDNPLDITAMGMSKPSLFGDTSAAMLADPGIDALLVAAMGGAPQQVMAKWKSLRPVLTTAEKPVALVFLGDELPMPAEFMDDIRASGVPFFRSPERAMRALANIARLDVVDDLPAVGVRTVDDTPAPEVVPEHRGKAILADVGFKVPAGRLATSAEEAVAAAAEIAGPVALKVQAASIAHKSDMGGVKLRLDGGDAVRAAWTEIESTVAKAAPGVPIDGMLVEEMAPPFPLEMVVSARRDPAWGVVVIAGLGGVFTELMRDIRMFPAGLSADRIRREIEALRGAPLLTGYRGGAALDVDAVVDVLDRLGRLLIDDPSLQEVEINPLAVYPRGEGVRILDVLMTRRTS